MTKGHGRTESRTSPRRIHAVEKQRQALELRMAGRTFTEIASTLGYANHGGAIAAVDRALERTLQPAADQFRALTLERLTKVLQVHWPAMLQRDEKSSALVLRTIKDLRELLGLDAPVKIQTDQPPPQVNVYLQEMPLRELLELRAAMLERLKIEAPPSGAGCVSPPNT